MEWGVSLAAILNTVIIKHVNVMATKKTVHKTRAWAVVSPRKDKAAHWHEVSFLRENLPEVTRGEKLVRVTIISEE